MKKFNYTLGRFMRDYPGFDWKNGRVVLVVRGIPYVCTASWEFLFEKHIDAVIKRYTHADGIMVITI